LVADPDKRFALLDVENDPWIVRNTKKNKTTKTT